MRRFGRIGRRVTEIIEVNGYGEGEYRYETIHWLKAGHRTRGGQISIPPETGG
jgi:hypothetical protein